MQYNGLRKKVAEGYLDVLRELRMTKHDKEDVAWDGRDENPEQKPNNEEKKRKRLAKMKTRKEIKEELETRYERIRQIRLVGKKRDVRYEEGYVNCLECVLEDLKKFKAKDPNLVWKPVFGSNDANYDRGRRDAIDWVMSS